MKKHNKEDVIKVGLKLFQTNGYFNTGTEDILKESDYPRSSFYYNFKSKEGFAENVIEYYGKKSEDFYNAILEEQKVKSPLERFGLFFSTVTDLAEKSQFKSECLIQKMAVECAGTNDVLRNVTCTQLQKMLGVFKSCIEEGQNKMEIRTDLESMDMAKFIHAQLYGGFLLSRLHNDVTIMKNNMKYALDYIRV